jgi:hypothetical protein
MRASGSYADRVGVYKRIASKKSTALIIAGSGVFLIISAVSVSASAYSQYQRCAETHGVPGIHDFMDGPTYAFGAAGTRAVGRFCKKSNVLPTALIGKDGLWSAKTFGNDSASLCPVTRMTPDLKLLIVNDRTACKIAAAVGEQYAKLSPATRDLGADAYLNPYKLSGWECAELGTTFECRKRKSAFGGLFSD